MVGSRRFSARTICLVLAIVVNACGVRSGPPAFQPATPGVPALTWLSEFTRPMGAHYPSLANSALFGSISGLVRDGNRNEWVGVIDERQDSRIAWISIVANAGQLSVTPTRIVMVRPGDGVVERLVTQADLEAIAMAPDGSFFMSEEGHISKGEVWDPGILQMTRDGVVTKIIAFPEQFRVRLDRSRGVRDNQGFEGLARTPQGHLIAGLEQPLIEDGPVSSFDRSAPGRLVEFVQHGREWAVERQWRYSIDPTPYVKGFDSICEGGENGLVELLAISETELFSMERACLEDSQTRQTANAIRIFNVDISGTSATKTLLLDLSSLTTRLSPALEHLDNFEGLSFGPPVNGRSTLLVVSDDNFRATQKTSFLLFRLQ